MKQLTSPLSRRAQDSRIFPKLLAVLTAIGVLPYFLLKLAWIFGSQWGIESPSKLDGTVVLMGNIITASLNVLLVAIVVALGRRAALKIPWWLILIPAWFAAGLLLPFIFTGPVIAAMVASGSGSSDGSLSAWVGPLVYLSFGMQAIGVVLVLGWYLAGTCGGAGAEPWNLTARRAWCAFELKGSGPCLAPRASLLPPWSFWGCAGSTGRRRRCRRNPRHKTCAVASPGSAMLPTRVSRPAQ